RADPPAVAQSGESTMGESGCIVGLAATEDLLVPGVVADERQLGEHHREERRQEQLPPGIAEVDEGHPAAAEREEVEPDARGVVPPASLEQTGLLDQHGQLGEIAAGNSCRRG